MLSRKDNFVLCYSDSMEVKSITTRKLRRRPNDPTPVPEKRRKPSPGEGILIVYYKI